MATKEWEEARYQLEQEANAKVELQRMRDERFRELRDLPPDERAELEAADRKAEEVRKQDADIEAMIVRRVEANRRKAKAAIRERAIAQLHADLSTALEAKDQEWYQATANALGNLLAGSALYYEVLDISGSVAT